MTRFFLFVPTCLAIVAATQSHAEVRVVTCEGPKMVVETSDKTVEELNIALGMTTNPQSPDAVLMRFETPSGPQVWNWSDDEMASLKGHCETQHYMKEKPLNGAWFITTDETLLDGCPEGASFVPQGMMGTRDLEWKWVFSPRVFLKGGDIDWDLEKINQNHWTATADAMPGLPGTVNIGYDFKVTDPTTILITGTVDLKIEAGAASTHCKGTVAMTARHQG